MRVLKLAMFCSVFLCFLACIWSPHKLEWGITGVYVFFISRYVMGVANPKVIGMELVRETNVIQMTNIIKRK